MTRRGIAGPALVVLTVAAAYAVTFDNYFVQDDFGVVWLLAQKPATYFPRWFVSTWMDDIWGYTPDEVRPFVAVTYQIAALWGAGSTVANHAINIAFHAATGLLVLGVARTAGGLGTPAATAAAVVFALLPNQTETVAWITGRVDSMPACFYAASFLSYALWRQRNGTRPAAAAATARPGDAYYVWSVAWCFVALFSKQNAITLVPALMLYDWLVLRRAVRPAWGWVRPYVPHVVLTCGYLLLRYHLFGQVAREELLTMNRLGPVLADVRDHLVRVVLGDETPGGIPLRLIVGSFVVLAAALTMAWRRRRLDGHTVRPLLYFAVAWTALGLAPTLVAGYASPRHAYLASIGWAITVGILCDLLWRRTPLRDLNGGGGRLEAARMAASLALGLLLAGYSLQLREALVDWEMRAAVSRQAVVDLEREALAAPDGTLIVAGVPPRSWAWALPFATRPPYTRTDLLARVTVISYSPVHCCGPDQWDTYTRERIRQWLARPDRPPVIAMLWDSQTGRVRRLSDQDDPYLRTLMLLLVETGSRAALDSNINRMLNEFVAFHRRSS